MSKIDFAYFQETFLKKNNAVVQIIVSSVSWILWFAFVAKLVPNSSLAIVIPVGAAAFLFASFDNLGFNAIDRNNPFSLYSYRIIQVLFQVVLVALTWLSTGSVAAPAWFLILWWMGVCDYLFYSTSKDLTFLQYEDMFWLWWAPVGIVSSFTKRTVHGHDLFLSTVIAVLSFGIYVLLFI